MPEPKERYLVLCVDRDDDLGKKTGVATPVLGRQAVVDAATKLGLADPEEADTNAMFAAVRKADDLTKKGVSCEVSVACGSQDGGFEADRKIRNQVESIVAGSNFDGIVFVSDGGDDEQVIPVLQNIRPIISVQRITIKHSATVEQTYAVLGRYLRMLVFDPRYSKWVLGVPGLIFLLAGILIVAQQVFVAQLTTLLIIGGAFFIRGFNIDRWIAGIVSQGPYGYLRLFSAVTSFLVVLVGLSTGYAYAVSQAGADAALVAANPVKIFTFGGVLGGYFLQGSLLPVWAGIAIYSTGALLAQWVRGTGWAWRDAIVLVMLALLYFPIDTFAAFLIGGERASTILLISYVLVGLAFIFGLTSIIVPRVRTKSSVATE